MEMTEKEWEEIQEQNTLLKLAEEAKKQKVAAEAAEATKAANPPPYAQRAPCRDRVATPQLRMTSFTVDPGVDVVQDPMEDAQMNTLHHAHIGEIDVKPVIVRLAQELGYSEVPVVYLYHGIERLPCGSAPASSDCEERIRKAAQLATGR